MTGCLNKTRKDFGFTLVELMITVTIVSILAMIIIPQFGDMIRKAREGQTKGNLGVIRSALNIYYSANEGWYPPYSAGIIGGQLDVLTANGRYLSSIPFAYLPPYHPPGSDYTATMANPVQEGGFDFGQVGPLNYVWMYVTNFDFIASPTPPSQDANIFLRCTHTDSKGTLWTAY